VSTDVQPPAEADEIASGAAATAAPEVIADIKKRADGPDPQRRSYASYASFSDPDGNVWLLQEITERLPGRV